ncbi:MAG: S-layer protein, partial [Gimesia sp.]|nr:S-layer protein [Gimesia sp.]
MKSLSLLLVQVFCLTAVCTSYTGSVESAELIGYLPRQAKSIHLTDPDASQQLLVTLKEEQTGSQRDVTREVKYEIIPAGVARVSSTGFVTPLSDGSATITARLNEKLAVNFPIVVSSFETQRPVNFYNDVIPQLTRGGCNSGACHGTPSGKNNF